VGIGGDPAVVAAQKAAMKRYRAAVNAFNLDDRARTIEGSIRLAELGLDPARTYVFDEPWASSADGKLVVKAALGPWGAKVASAEGR
jgi:hypothetical protein